MTKAEQVCHLVRNKAPRGIVVTYGNISQMVYGHRGAGRAVGQAIKAREDESGFPWWRVVDSNWLPKQAGQRERLQCEGVTFDPPLGRVNQRHRFKIENI